MELATGEFIYFIDSDDCLISDAMEVCYHYTKMNDVDVAMSGEEYTQKYWLYRFCTSACLIYTSAKYLKTYNYRFIPGEITMYEESKINYIYPHIKDFLKNRKLIIFGCGILGKRLLGYIKKGTNIDIECFCDNNVGQVIYDNGTVYNVISPCEAVQRYRNSIYIIAASRKNCKEMEVQLLKYGIPSENIFCMNSNLEYECTKYIPVEQYETILSMQYREKGLGELNLVNPHTYNEYIIREMLYEVTPLKSKLVDKVSVRAWIKEKIGEEYLIPVYAVWNNVDDIDIENLPEKCVLKMNHGCGYNILIQNKKLLVWEEEKRKLKKWEKIDFSLKHFELQYHNIKPMVICEKYLENNRHAVNDFKVFCFNGKPIYIMFLTDRETQLKMAFYDRNWVKMDFVYNYPRYESDVPRPSSLDKMLQLSAVLSKEFRQVRIDWYILDDGSLKFGEMTFSSCNGMARWNPAEWNEKLGELIRDE